MPLVLKTTAAIDVSLALLLKILDKWLDSSDFHCPVSHCRQVRGTERTRRHGYMKDGLILSRSTSGSSQSPSLPRMPFH